jgi:hypothetical protein
MPEKKAALLPFQPAPYENADIYALQALANGTASEGQQQRALRWIIEPLCGTYDLPWRPGGLEGARLSDFAAGKQFCGQQIVKLLKLRPAG